MQTLYRLVCVSGITLKGNDEVFRVCVTDTQPKECKGVLKRQMDVVTVDYGGRLTGFVMKETEGLKENHVFHYKDPRT